MSIKEIVENSKFWFLPALMLAAGAVGLLDLHAEVQNREPIRIEGSFSTTTPLSIEGVSTNTQIVPKTAKKSVKKTKKEKKVVKKVL